MKIKVANQIIAPLPSVRLKRPLHTFARIAVDYTGPFITITIYLLLHAVHTEMVVGTDIDSFLDTFFE